MNGENTPEYFASRASRGDEASFIALCDILKTKLYRTAKGVLGNETLALDALSEGVCRAFKGIRQLREPKYAETWFTRIVLNAANDIHRREAREFVTDTVPEGEHYDDYSVLEIGQLVGALPRKLREIISLKYYSGYTLAEIAEILNIPEGTVKSRLGRALKTLRVEVLP